MASRFRWPTGRRRRPRPPLDETYNVSESEAAELMLMSRSAVAYLRRTGKGPIWVKLGGRIYYAVEDLFAFYRQRTGKNIPPPIAPPTYETDE
jgi:hypothetical protein